MRKVIVTGAGGLLGSHLLPLLEGGNDVYAVCRAAGSLAAANVTVVELDLSHPVDRSALPDKIDAVIYLAQSNRYRDFPGGAPDVFQVNTAQPLAMLDYARGAGVTNFVYASTGGVYGVSKAVLSEDAPTPPQGQTLGFYPASKLAAEFLSRPYQPFMNIAVLRYFFIYGAGQKPEMLIPRLLQSVRQGGPINLQGECGLRINPVHVSDAAQATAAAARLDRSTTINVAGPEVLSLREIGEAAGQALGQNPIFTIEPAPEPASLVADTGRMRSLLVEPTCSFKAGLAQMIQSDGKQ